MVPLFRCEISNERGEGGRASVYFSDCIGSAESLFDLLG
jgi:hypothetical protein